MRDALPVVSEHDFFGGPGRVTRAARVYASYMYWAYGTGYAGDLLSHEMDFVQCVLGHGIPDNCVCSGQDRQAQRPIDAASRTALS